MNGRTPLTPAERAGFRRQRENAAPEQQDLLWREIRDAGRGQRGAMINMMVGRFLAP